MGGGARGGAGRRGRARREGLGQTRRGALGGGVGGGLGEEPRAGEQPDGSWRELGATAEQAAAGRVPPGLAPIPTSHGGTGRTLEGRTGLL